MHIISLQKYFTVLCSCNQKRQSWPHNDRKSCNLEISRIRIDSIFEIGASSITQATEIFKTSTIDDQRAFTGMNKRTIKIMNKINIF